MYTYILYIIQLSSEGGLNSGGYIPRRIPSWYISTILGKTVEKIVYLGRISLNIVAVPVLSSLPSPEGNVVVYSKESPIPGRL